MEIQFFKKRLVSLLREFPIPLYEAILEMDDSPTSMPLWVSNFLRVLYSLFNLSMYVLEGTIK